MGVTAVSDARTIVIFTDLDGTLLDPISYSFAEAVPALRLIKERRIPLVICSSKTAAEIEYYREKLENGDPFIAENGGGVFVPKGYFPFSLTDARPAIEIELFPMDADDAYEAVRLGATYEELRMALGRLKQMGLPLKGFGDMSAEEIAGITGLPLREAQMARQRAFDEPFVIEGDRMQEGPLRKAIEGLGFRYTFGRLSHLMGSSDKGRAVSLLAAMYRSNQSGNLSTVGIGDAPNDLAMLWVVDHPVIVQQPDGSYGEGMEMPGLIRARGKGPDGWNAAVLNLLKEFQ